MEVFEGLENTPKFFGSKENPSTFLLIQIPLRTWDWIRSEMIAAGNAKKTKRIRGIFDLNSNSQEPT